MAGGKRIAADRGAWVVFEDEASQSLRPPRARTWGRVGRTPVVRVRGRGSGRISMAGMSCYKTGERPRLIYRSRLHRGRRGEPKGFTWRDYRDLIVRARIQLGGPVVLVWDNLAAHKMPQLKAFFEASADWLTVFYLPAYAPDLNPQEGIWSQVKRGIGNLAAASVDHLAAAVKHRLKKIQHRPQLIDACLTQAGLSLNSPP